MSQARLQFSVEIDDKSYISNGEYIVRAGKPLKQGSKFAAKLTEAQQGDGLHLVGYTCSARNTVLAPDDDSFMVMVARNYWEFFDLAGAGSLRGTGPEDMVYWLTAGMEGWVMPMQASQHHFRDLLPPVHDTDAAEGGES